MNISTLALNKRICFSSILSDSAIIGILLFAVEDVDGDHVCCRCSQSTRGECDDLCSVLLPADLDESEVSDHCLLQYYFQ